MKNITPGFSILCETGLQETKMFYVLLREYNKTDSIEIKGETKQEV